MTWLAYQEDHKGRVHQVVMLKMTPALASWAVKERFSLNIKPDTIRMASYKYSSKEAVQDPVKKRRVCILPREVEEGMVEIVELLQSSCPPFPVLKSFLIKCTVSCEISARISQILDSKGQ